VIRHFEREKLWYTAYNVLLYTTFMIDENYAVGSQTQPINSNKASDYAVEYFVNDDATGLPVLLLEIKPERSVNYISKREEADMQARSRFEQVMNENQEVQNLVVISAIGTQCCVYSGSRTLQGISIYPPENHRDPRRVNDTVPLEWWNIDILTPQGRDALDVVFSRVKTIRPRLL